jgi:murein DD-endopeptidase MepM/ murein hydrolase activator NlpD
MPTGTQLYAVAAGRVLWGTTDPPFFCSLLGTTVTDQLFVEIAHDLPNGEQVTSVYVHLDAVFVQRNDTVEQGDVIGLSGNTGCSTEPHLHFHVWRLAGNTNSGNSVRIDPYGWRAWNRSDPWAAHSDGAASLYLWIDPPPLCVVGGTCHPTRYDDLP